MYFIKILEPPDGPQEVHVVETGSRSVKLAWSAPQYTGNSHISHYIIQYKDEGGTFFFSSFL